ncbi:MAG: hypothetical protein ABIV39_07185 [Verrucomicrobiota bacterium]
MLLLLSGGCSNPPPAPASRFGVSFTSRNNTHLNLDSLPIEDYPALKKFHKLREVQYGTATDEKMEALANVGLTNLRSASLNGSSYISDRGIEALAQIRFMDSLGLEGTAITDRGVDLIAKRMHPRGVNVAACTKVTVDGLLKLAQSETMESLSFSVGEMMQADLIRLIHAAAPQLVRMDIDMVESTERRLDFPALRREAEEKR